MSWIILSSINVNMQIFYLEWSWITESLYIFQNKVLFSWSTTCSFLCVFLNYILYSLKSLNYDHLNLISIPQKSRPECVLFCFFHVSLWTNLNKLCRSYYSIKYHEISVKCCLISADLHVLLKWIDSKLNGRAITVWNTCML